MRGVAHRLRNVRSQQTAVSATRCTWTSSRCRLGGLEPPGRRLVTSPFTPWPGSGAGRVRTPRLAGLPPDVTILLHAQRRQGRAGSDLGYVCRSAWRTLTRTMPVSIQPGAGTAEGSEDVRSRCCDVFPSPRHEKKGPLDVSALAHGISRNLEHFGVASFYAHDLRRTAATGMAELGADWTVLQTVLDHKLRGARRRSRSVMVMPMK